MKYINLEKLQEITAHGFKNNEPFYWSVESDFLTKKGFYELCVNMPDIKLFEHDLGMTRKFGEKPHERFRLWFHKVGLRKLPRPWQDFISELNSKTYLEFVSSVYGVKDFYLRLEWHYTPTGATVYPHLDGYTTYGAHLFYFNPAGYWDNKWGGGTQVLKGKKKFELYDHPDFEDFEIVGESSCVGNTTLMFKNSPDSWHSVAKLNAPAGVYRRLFTVFISKPQLTFFDKLKNKIRSFFFGSQRG